MNRRQWDWQSGHAGFPAWRQPPRLYLLTDEERAMTPEEYARKIFQPKRLTNG